VWTRPGSVERNYAKARKAIRICLAKGNCTVKGADPH